jgi:hypothetical protein
MTIGRLSMSDIVEARKTKGTRQSTKPHRRKTILEVGDDGWVTIRLPWRLLRAVLLACLAFFIVAIVAMILSPDLAARVAWALIQLAGLLSKTK